MKSLIYSFLLVALFTGCESKKYFEPEDVRDDIDLDAYEINDNVVDYTPNGVTLDDNTFLSKNIKIETKLKDGFKFLNDDGKTILSSDFKGDLLLQSGDEEKLLSFSTNIIAASKKDNLIALISSENIAMLYDIDKEKTVFKEYLNISRVNDIKMPSPVFLNSLVLYPSLDGKVLIVDTNTNSIYKTINIDPKSEINNVTFLKTIDDSLVAATPNKIFTFNKGRINIKPLEVRYIAVNKKNLFVATLDGRIIKYDLMLNELASKKFKFAKFHALGYGSKLYALESQGYMITLDENLESSDIYEFDFDNEQKVITIGDKLYFESYFTILK